ncbi:MAG: helix-turn-helix domain-containing protein [Clostridiales bacterium]|jgi:transcriptional regulator with XRE-family HTH domain|nr:helix-turn-helix domain-containing protein [Clostridiales bacterium]
MPSKRSNNIYLLADKIKKLREQKGLTQSELARKLDLTRSSVNGWEMGLVVPSTQIIVELSHVFNVSADYLLGLDEQITLRVNGLTDKEIASLMSIIECYKESKS